MIINKKFIICAVIYLFLSIGCNNSGRGYRLSAGGNYIGTKPSMSPNGKQIVFGSPRYNCGDICIVKIDGSNWQRLTTSPEYDGEPTFSIDSSRIVFISERDDKNTGHVYIMNADGSNQMRVTKSKQYDSDPAFSPDGATIVFSRLFGDYNWEIFTINTDGTDEKRLTFDEGGDSYPHFSADGKKIIYVAKGNSGRSALWAMNTDGSSKNIVIEMMERCGSPGLSADDHKIVFVNAKELNYQDEANSKIELWIMNRDGSEQKQITFTKSYKEFPSFSPDGKKILFFEPDKNGRGKGKICIINVDGSGLRTITNNY
jgi:Tol biopolymer transport system component